MGRITSRLTDLPERDKRPRIIRIEPQRVDELILRFPSITMLLGQASQLDMRLSIRGSAGRPLLEVFHGIVSASFFHEEYGERPLAGHMVRIPSEAEVVVLLGHLTIGLVAEDLRLLVVGRAKVVKAVRISWLSRERLLEMVDRPEVVALLVELNALGRVVSAHPAAASRCNDDDETEKAGAERHGADFRMRGGEGTDFPPLPTSPPRRLQKPVSRR